MHGRPPPTARPLLSEPINDREFAAGSVHSPQLQPRAPLAALEKAVFEAQEALEHLGVLRLSLARAERERGSKRTGWGRGFWVLSVFPLSAAVMASDLPNVAIEPKELLFSGPNHREPIARHLALTNPHNRDVCFKVKTTAPKRYYVRPNAARLRANTSDTVEGAQSRPSPEPLGSGAHWRGACPQSCCSRWRAPRRRTTGEISSWCRWRGWTIRPSTMCRSGCAAIARSARRRA